MSFITGQQEIINNLMMAKSKKLRKIGIAVEKTCVDVSNDAKRDHKPGVHARNRYENDTVMLTRATTPALQKIDFKEVIGIVYNTMDYAPMVELGTAKSKPYPFLYPALVKNKENFKNRIKEAMK